ncbi:hypothetical protein R5W24_001077 [Gemmata sp. JC717]|uniref:hypothetical protein n=1 Tax=Gemmata algarum TaxID=2975278 RepID=UPI0021BAF227|nr:hypothetical protein [Gemmata algarum]MDY3551997.1 hypothetical protein [Gemmata algarum]
MTNEGLLHALWEAIEDEGTAYTLCCVGPNGDAARATLPADARRVWIVWGAVPL